MQPTCTSSINTATSPNTITIIVTSLETANSHSSYDFFYQGPNPSSAVIIPRGTIKCEALDSNDQVLVEPSNPSGFFMVDIDVQFDAMQSGNPIELTPITSEAGTASQVNVKYKLAQNFPNNGFFVLQVPKANQYYLAPSSFGASTSTSMASTGQLAGTATFTPFTTVYSCVISYALDANTNPTTPQFDHIRIQILTNGAILAASSTAGQGELLITIPSFVLPPSTKPVSQITGFTATTLGPPALLTEKAYTQ